LKEERERERERERESQFNTAGGSEFQVRGAAANAGDHGTAMKDRACVSYQKRCSVLDPLQRVCDLLRRRRQDRVAIIDSIDS